MSEYQRLTNKDWKENYDIFEDVCCDTCAEDCGECERNFNALVRLAELEDMIECGQLVFKSSLISKYKNGDTVYCVLRGLANGMAYYVKEMKIRRIYLGKTKITYYLKGCKYGFGENQIFATKAEAEAKLKELQEKE